jgi:hypothetical protein
VDLAEALIEFLAGAAVAAENVKPKPVSANIINIGRAPLWRRYFDINLMIVI